MLYLDYLSYKNKLNGVSVSEKVLFSIVGLTAAVWFSKASTLLAILVLTHVVMLYAKVPPGYLVRLWLGPAAFITVGLLTVVINISPDVFPAYYIIQTGPVYFGITESGLQQAQLLALRSAAAVSCLFVLAATTPVMHIVALGARVPGLRTVMEITLLTYRFIFVILAAAGRIYTAQQSRLGYTDRWKTLSSLGALASNLGRTAFLTARDLNIALLSRNYTERLVLRCPEQPVNPIRAISIILVWSALVWVTAL